ncbi:359_t:CDS:2 [Cetraspora pellucida]|uniref:359_t:CDS:1 n=1 Tax=Cetraspora pellucida TaxID=1433469 RepID=A0ACA9KEX7_9GLOM|nr:359_t:CDS:2 [Cetraspora pellucida]
MVLLLLVLACKIPNQKLKSKWISMICHVILISDDDLEIIGASTLEDVIHDDIKIIEVTSQSVNIKLKLKDEIDSNLMNQNTGFYNDLTLSNDSWNVDTTEKLQEPNNQDILHY